MLEIKNSKNVSSNTLSKSVSKMVHDWTDSLVLRSHVNSDLVQNRRNRTACCLYNQYYALRKNVSADSEFLFGDDLTTRIINVTAYKKLFSTSKTFFQSKLLF